MRTTIDGAGRLVIPKELRDEVGLSAGLVEIERQGSGLHIEPATSDGVVREGRLLVIAPSGQTVSDADVIALRDADRARHLD